MVAFHFLRILTCFNSFVVFFTVIIIFEIKLPRNAAFVTVEVVFETFSDILAPMLKFILDLEGKSV